MKVKELLNETNWVKNHLATDKNNHNIEDPLSTEAYRWCLLGAIIKCHPSNTSNICEKVRNKINNSIVTWNNRPERTWEDVKELIEKLDI